MESMQRPPPSQGKAVVVEEAGGHGGGQREHIQDTFRSQTSSSWSPWGQGDGNPENSSQVSGPDTSMDGGALGLWRF